MAGKSSGSRDGCVRRVAAGRASPRGLRGMDRGQPTDRRWEVLGRVGRDPNRGALDWREVRARAGRASSGWLGQRLESGLRRALGGAPGSAGTPGRRSRRRVAAGRTRPGDARAPALAGTWVRRSVPVSRRVRIAAFPAATPSGWLVTPGGIPGSRRSSMTTLAQMRAGLWRTPGAERGLP
jgi:hypothetical protein